MKKAGRPDYRREIDAPAGGLASVDVRIGAPEVVFVSRTKLVPVKPEPRRDPTYRTIGAIVAGAGVVGIGIGAVFGLVAISNRSDARSICGDPNPAHCHDESGLASWHDAKSAGTISMIAFAVGGALLATGGMLWFAALLRSDDRTVGAIVEMRVSW